MENPKIILINPPSPFLADDKAQPPAGLMYLAANLELNEMKVCIEDLAGKLDWKEKVTQLKADIFGVTCTTPNFPIVKKIGELLPSRSLKIIGGVHPTFLPEEVLKTTKFDVVVRNEGDTILLEIIKDYKLGKKLNQIYNGGFVNVDEIPLPARHLVNLKEYRPEMEGQATTIFSSRGCPYNCAFCCKITENKVRLRKIEDVVNEVGILTNKYGYKNIIFEDDNFCINPIRVKQICERIKDFNLNIRICPRIDSLDYELLKVLRDAGVTEISFGIESGSQKMLDLMNKELYIDACKSIVKMVKDMGTLVKIYLIVGFPGETEETVEETKKFVEEIKPDKWLLQNFIPYPGTDVWKNPEKYGVLWISKNYEDFYTVGKGAKGGIVFRTKELDEEKIKLLHDDLYNFLMKHKPMYRG